MIKGIKILFFMLASTLCMVAQMEIEFGATGTPTPGSTFNVDVNVNGLDNILSMEYWILWDSTVLSFNSVTNVTMDLPGFDVTSVSTPTNSSFGDGIVTVTWNDPDVSAPYGSLSDGSTLFSINFDVVGAPCDSTALEIGDNPDNVFQDIEIYDGNLNLLTLTADPLPALIPGSDCSEPEESCGVDNPDGTVGLYSATDLCVEPGSNICIPVLADGFTGVGSMQGGMTWDSTLFTYTGTSNFNLPGMGVGNFNLFSTDSLIYVWDELSGANPVTLPDGSPLFEVCFDAIGNIGDASMIEYVDVGNAFIDIAAGMSIPYYTNCGTVTIMEDCGSCTFTIDAQDINPEAGTNFCIPFVATCFEDIIGIQYTMTWDSDNITYTGVDNLNSMMSLFPTNFNYEPTDVLTFQWNSPTAEGFAIPDGSIMYEVCFDIASDCPEGETIDITFASSPTNIDITNGDLDPEMSNLIGSTITCIGVDNPCLDSDLAFDLNATGVDCFGDENGSITVNATGGEGPYSCMWENEDGDAVFGGGSCQILEDLASGTYFLTLTDNNNCELTGSVEVGSPANPLTIEVSGTNANCDGSGGTISVLAQGGTGSYDYDWSPTILPGNMSSYADVDPNTYNVTVSDENGCEVDGSVTIETDGSLDVTGTQTNFTCDGNGSITLTISGSNLSFDWLDIPGSPNNQNRTDLVAGNYEVSVTDSETGCTGTASFMIINEIEAVVVTGVEVTNAGCGTEGTGSISVTATGGCDDCYECFINGSNTAVDCSLIDNLPVGNHTVCVQQCDDANNEMCSDFEITNEITPLQIDELGAENISCFGAEDGSLNPVISGGCAPYMCFIGGIEVDCDDINFNNATSGDFTVRDNDGTEVTQAFDVTEPSEIVVTVDEINDFGPGSSSILITPSGGNGNYTFMWTNTDGTFTSMDEDILNIDPDVYTVVVMDDSGCSSDVTVIPLTGIVTIDEVVVISNDFFNDFGVSCNGVCDGEISANILLGVAPYDIALTSSGVTTNHSVFPIMGLCAGDYTMQITDSNGASMASDVNFTITAPDPLVVTTDTVVDATGGESNGSISILVEGGAGGYTYNWTPVNEDMGPVFSNIPGGTYSVFVEDSNGCIQQLIEEVGDDSIVEPDVCYEGITVMTPNDDNVNDFFLISCNDSDDHEGTQLAMYDRWGRNIYNATDYDNSWFGIDLDGNELPEGAYFWVFEVDFGNGEKELRKGTVTLLRNL